MSDKLPSLFDFDDEDFFPKSEKPEEKTADPTGLPPAADTGEESQVPGLTEAEPVDEVLAEETPLDDITAEVAEIQGKEVGESLSKDYTKPKLELPGRAGTDDFGKLSDTQAFDKQIGNTYQQKAAAFIFEPRKETKAEEVIYQPEPLEVKDTDPADIPPDPQSDAESNDENIPAPEVIIDPLPEWTLDKNYYTIGEVAQLFEVNVSHIRFWTTEFKMKTRTTRKGDRLYTPAQIGELRLIHHLVKIKKYTLKGAKEILKSGNIQLEKKLNLKEELQKLYQELLALKDSL